MTNQSENNNEKLIQTHKGEIKITGFTWCMIAFLCILWPAMIMIFFSPPADNPAIEQSNVILNIYLPTVVMQGFVMTMLFLVARSERTSLKSLGYGRPLFIHILQAILFLFISSIILYKLKELLVYLNIFTFDLPTSMLPKYTSGKVIWVMFSAIVAFIEESAYRGYLISRLTKISGSKIAGVIIASAGFALGHLYQGTGGAVLLFIFALMFSILFLRTKSLWPCVLAHFLFNSLAAFVKP